MILLVGAGGFIGSVLRYAMSLLLPTRMLGDFPVSTLLVNIVGSFLIGVIFFLASKGMVSKEMQLFLATGICGGFTTLSAFSLETMNLYKSGQTGLAALYVALSVGLGLLAVFGGLKAAKML